MRSRTPGVSSRVESSSMAKPPSPAKPSGKRKAKFGVDSVSDTGLPVLIVPTASSHVSIPPTPLSPKDTDSRKKVRLSSPASSLEEVPGSVSGEEEMLCEPRRVRAAVLSSESVAKWRAESSPLSDLPGDMEVDEDSKHTAQAEQSVERDATPPYQQLTPPQTTTKTPLNTAAKTQQLIAEIRAKAFAAARSSPTSEEARPFKETLSDSESSEDEFLRGIKGKGKGKTCACSNCPV
ncbi:hypothetical protein BT96DRAFT_11810 [Gymnopus androsaceus JB14]|uniref:Uncharacterized protein n=1 Tax=Gymnopus androsaceus JB14 TaxID=1447944 RepID=A0A6A4ILC7_9AGAR|nr:hypothetical protein BT96DRAFT_11810 [Gymnopus androsaceus JB14]